MQEVQVVGLLGREPHERVDQPAIGLAALQLRAPRQRRDVPGIGRQRTFELALGRRRVLAAVEE